MNIASGSKTGKPFTEFGWMNQLSELATQPLHLQTAFWHETMTTAADVAQLQADWLQKLSAVTTPQQVAALNAEYAQNLFRKGIEESSRLTAALNPAGRKAA
ncbi:phasin family protein [Paenirhodobacter populi]|uniref:Phasin domain-containing protein n=1 Tax=Paenirhodobacter populi TaxID=2306993 RepID=A0A443IW54_9RHOB|nr:phasin family protein [Sinirhodobacter populi]RWR12315.1 hypothetical protein D2T33_09420 [Sinirhodobacter populi]